MTTEPLHPDLISEEQDLATLTKLLGGVDPTVRAVVVIWAKSFAKRAKARAGLELMEAMLARQKARGARMDRLFDALASFGGVVTTDTVLRYGLYAVDPRPGHWDHMDGDALMNAVDEIITGDATKKHRFLNACRIAKSKIGR